MKYGIALCTAITAPLVALAEDGWLKSVPPSVGNDWSEIAKDQYFEVPVSRFVTANYRLSGVEFVAQEQNEVVYYGGGSLKCPPPSKTYLVRALYLNGGTGTFRLYWAGSALIVSHGSLGSPPEHPNKSALVACLVQEPTAVYSALSSAL